MIEYPMRFDECNRQFYSEDQCLDYLYRQRFPGGFVCPQ
ncbi:hypothetical protein Holit_02208 [Hollandina sp. SP2]